MTKERADILVVQQGLTPSREQAKRLIMAGQIYNQNNQRIDKPGEKWARTTQLHIKGEGLPYVSRGGLPWDYDPSRRQMLNRLSHPGAPTSTLLSTALHSMVSPVGSAEP